MKLRPGWLFLFCTLLLTTGANAQRSNVHVPQELESWRGWVLQGQEFRACPFFYQAPATERGDFLCSWPDQLNLSVTSGGGRFSQLWTVYAEDQWVALPGNATVWPQSVTVAGNAVEVVLRNGAPAVWLEPGRHAIAGQFGWDERPRTLAVPSGSGLIALTVDGERIERPQRNRNASRTRGAYWSAPRRCDQRWRLPAECRGSGARIARKPRAADRPASRCSR